MTDIFTVLLALAGVVALIIFTYYGANWLNKRVRFTANSMIKIHERSNLGADKAMIVASVGEKYMLIGITQESITKITDLDKTDIEKLIDDKKNNQKQPFAVSFASALMSRKQQKGGEDNDT